ncbi:glutathionylspermidine synthase family protein [Deinococcus sonorensis]|uniref:Glutathionylspermidine synthase family protein n=2 Tax=Deinococcus sonorensis TaxID=309891 RepID=A0AAU7U6K4_9DEIO
MQRLTVRPRPDADARLQGVAIDWADHGYWQEQAAYAFTLAEIERIEAASQTLVTHLLDTVGFAIEQRRLGDLGIPTFLHETVRESWLRGDPDVYMRLDLAYDGHHLHLLECNGQTPTSLIEASVAQWQWLEDQLALQHLEQGCDQWNGMHEQLLARWGELSSGGVGTVHFAAGDNSEDLATVTYLQDLAEQAGLRTRALSVSEIGQDHQRRHLIGTEGEDIRHLMWLWPFEFAWEEAFAPELSLTHTRFIEPLWKTVLCSKGILALLHERYPDCPEVLPATLHVGTLGGEVVRKPLYSREGQNVTIVGQDHDATGGQYGDLRMVEQQYSPLPQFVNAQGEPRFPVLGVWVAGRHVCGMGVREAARRITDDRASFVPHLILPGGSA